MNVDTSVRRMERLSHSHTHTQTITLESDEQLIRVICVDEPTEYECLRNWRAMAELCVGCVGYNYHFTATHKISHRWSAVSADACFECVAELHLEIANARFHTTQIGRNALCTRRGIANWSIRRPAHSSYVLCYRLMALVTNIAAHYRTQVAHNHNVVKRPRFIDQISARISNFSIFKAAMVDRLRLSIRVRAEEARMCVQCDMSVSKLPTPIRSRVYTNIQCIPYHNAMSNGTWAIIIRVIYQQLHKLMFWAI